MHRLSFSNSPSRISLIYGGRADRALDNRVEEVEERKDTTEEDKREKLRSGVCRSEGLVHFIPVILILCILVLYLFSYDPIQKESAMVGDLGLSSAGDLLALYDRSPQQTAKKDVTATPSPPLFRNRKLANF